jgi:hypothetical protein
VTNIVLKSCLHHFAGAGLSVPLGAKHWIRSTGNFDAVVDFDLVVQDGSHPALINPAFDPGDHLHPNVAGNRAMADAFDLTIFARRQKEQPIRIPNKGSQQCLG